MIASNSNAKTSMIKYSKDDTSKKHKSD